jgi:hypothetical protein
MARFNTAVKNPVKKGIVTEQVATGKTYNGAPGFARDTMAELFLLAVNNFVGSNSFYETGAARDTRMSELAAKAAIQDVDGLTAMVRWIRQDGNMRTAPIVIAAEGAHARLAAGLEGGNRQLLRASLQRADEMGELLGYWKSAFGKKFPKALKRALSDAVGDIVNEYSVIKYDTAGKEWRFGDILHVAQPATLGNVSEYKNVLYKHVIDRRHGRDTEIPSELKVLRRNKEIMSLSPDEKRSLLNSGELDLDGTGVTWEQLASSISGGLDSKFWEAMIPKMGYMALLRNLRNFQQAGISKTAMNTVLARLRDPEEVAKSRQLPMRFLSAYNANKSNLAIASALEDALDASLANVPALDGKTLVLVDRSGSMFGTVSEKSGLNFADSAALFGAALALRGENVDLVEFGTGSKKISYQKGNSILPLVNKFGSLGGTDTRDALVKHFKGHDRIVLITDEQANGWYSGWSFHQGDVLEAAKIPASVVTHTFNLVGYRYGQAPSGTKNRFHVGGGLTDSAFKLIPLLEAAGRNVLPWEVKN